MFRSLILFGSYWLALVSFSVLAEPVPELLQLKTFEAESSPDIMGWVYSEKLDGIRAYWNGSLLQTKNGTQLHPPASFLAQLPPFALDGELWTQRNDFENIASIVLTKAPSGRWQGISYYVFEVPNQPGDLQKRLTHLKEYLARHDAPQIRIVKQHPVMNLSDLLTVLDTIVAQGGEGLVVRDPSQPYLTGRSDRAFKLKKYQDKECRVVGYKAGKGRLEGVVGALKCRLVGGKIFYVGSGLSDADRKDPPSIGQVITFKYYGKTAKDLPRFPVFMRVRPEETLGTNAQ